MATQIVILNGDSILVDNHFSIEWSDKGKNWEDAWCPNTVHAVIWNNLQGQNEIQNKDASTGNMTGNTDLNATSDAVGSTTVADLLTWAEIRKTQMEEAIQEYFNALAADEANGTNNALADWQAYDPHHS
jgi:hypothetical protein